METIEIRAATGRKQFIEKIKNLDHTKVYNIVFLYKGKQKNQVSVIVQLGWPENIVKVVAQVHEWVHVEGKKNFLCWKGEINWILDYLAVSKEQFAITSVYSLAVNQESGGYKTLKESLESMGFKEKDNILGLFNAELKKESPRSEKSKQLQLL